MFSFLLPLLLVLAVAMTGCNSGSGSSGGSGGGTDSAEGNTATPSGTDGKAKASSIDKTKIEGDLKVLTPWGAGFKDQFAKMFEDFNKEFPNIKVTLMEQTTADLAALISAGETPDVISSNGLATDLRKDDMIEELTPYIKTDGDVKPDLYYPPAYNRSVDVNGKVWALPWHVDPNFALMYNKDVLEQYGYTSIPETHSLQEWGDFLHKYWVVENGEQVMTTYAPHEVYGPFNSLMTAAYMNGATADNFYNPKTNKATFNDPLIVQALEWIVQFKRENVDDERMNKLNSTLPKNTGRFQAGKSLMEPHVTPVLRDNYKANPKLGFAPMPAESLWVGGWSWSITTVGKKENKDAAWQLLKWMTSTKQGAEAQQKYFGWISGIKDNPYLEEQAKTDPVTQVAVEVLKNAKKLPPTIPVDIGKEFETKWADVMKGDLEPKAFLDHMTEFTQALLDEQANKAK